MKEKVLNPNQAATNKVRLNKLLSQHGLCSRRKAEEWIEAGRISVDGLICRDLSTQVDPNRQTISLDGKPLESPPEHLYLALNKPVGIISTRKDPQGRKTILDLLPESFKKMGLFSVGRLDGDTEGLLLVTNDGDWSQILSHPSHHIWKLYEVECDKPFAEEHLTKLSKGLMVNGKRTLPAKVKRLKSPNRIRLELCEGRNRQIRRMCSKLGFSVKRLKRLKVGPIELGNLGTGEFRELSSKEIAQIWALSSENKK